MTTLTTPDNLVKWTTSDPASIIAANNQLADSVQEALDVRSAKSYTWADKFERDAQTGMANGHTGFQEDISVNWRYDGTVWKPDISTPFADVGVAATEISGGGSIDYNGTIFSARGLNSSGGLVGLYQLWTNGSTSYINPLNTGLVPIVPNLVSPVTGVTIHDNGAIQLVNVGSAFNLRDAFPTMFRDYRIVYKFTNNSSAAPPTLRLSGIGGVSSGSVYDTIRNGTINGGATNDQSPAQTNHIMSFSTAAGTVRMSGTIDVSDANDAGQPTFMLQHSFGTLNPMAAATTTSVGTRATQHRTLAAYDGFEVTPVATSISGYIKIYAYNELGPGV